MNPKTRKRSVTLDAIKFQQLVAENNLTKSLFEDEMIKLFGVHNTTAQHLWNGEKLDKSRAKKAVNHLGLSSYESLLPTLCPEIVFPEKLPWNAQYSPPGSLLKAEYGIVPFHFRHKELEELDTWCNSVNKLAVRLYTGAGGMGKTRLAIEQCNRLKKDNWLAGFLNHQSLGDKRKPCFTCFKTINQSVFIVVDYAETRREELVELLKSALYAKCKLRIILLARSAVDWWNTLKTESKGVGDLVTSPASSWVTLQSLSLQYKQREDSYLLAAESFAKALEKDPPLFAPDDLNADYFERVLLLHMQALIHIEDPHDQQELSEKKGLQAILNVILNRERRFWEVQANNKNLPKGLHQTIGEVMARITLIGGVKTKQDAKEVINAIPLLAKSQIYEQAIVLKLLQGLYPCNQAFQDKNMPNCNYIEPLQPDLLGEHLMSEELEKNAESILDDIFG